MIGVLINEKLRNYPPLVSLIGKKVFPIIADDGSEMPYLTYSVSLTELEYVKSNVYENESVIDTLSVIVKINSKTYINLQEISWEVRNALEGEILIGYGINTRPIHCTGTGEGFDDKTRGYEGIITFEVEYNKKI